MIKKPSKGYLVVASRKPNFYSLAINCIESIKDYYPDAKCCLVTEEKFLDGREDIADDLTWKSRQNFTLRHFMERINIYNEEEFDYTIKNLKIEG